VKYFKLYTIKLKVFWVDKVIENFNIYVMLTNFDDYIYEEYLKLDLPLYYTKELKSTLGAIASKGDSVASFLYYGESTDSVRSDITFVGLGEGNDKVSFIQVNRVLRMIDKELGDPESKNQGILKGQLEEDYINKIWRIKQNFDHPAWKEQRTELGVGRFATKIAQKAGKNFTPTQINTFVDKFKAYIDFQTTKKDKFEVVSGEDIRKWYDEDTYEDAEHHLSNSCMRYARCQRYLDIYVENPNQVSMVILKGTVPNKIIGRALIWKLKDGDYYLDRPYANNDEDINLFKEWGRSKGYSVYGANYNHKEVELDKSNFSYYPYMDTFKYLNRDDKTLSTDANEYDNGNEDWIRLEDTSGGYTEAQRGIYSEYYDEYIDEDSAVFAEDIQSYIHSDDAIYLEYKDSYVHNDADVVYSEFDGQYYLSEDAIKSEYLDSYIYSDDALNVFISIDQEDYVPDSFTQKGIVKEYFVDGSPIWCISANVFKSPFSNEYFFRTSQIKVFTTEDGTLMTQNEADEKDIDTGGLESEYMDIDEYLSKRIKPLTKDEFLEKVKSLEFRENQVNSFKRNCTSSLYSLGAFFTRLTDDEVERLMKLLIWLGHSASEKNEFGKPKRRNRKNLISDLKEQCEEFIKNERFYELSSNSIEALFQVMDSNLSDYITDEELLSQIILYKNSI